MIDNPLKDNDDEEQTETETETENDMKLPAEKLLEESKENKDPEEVPEEEVMDGPFENSDRSKCTRYTVCENIVYGSTCPECWEDIRVQLETPDGCEECGSNRFKFIPDGEEVGLKCNECGHTEWQEVEYTGDDEEGNAYESAANNQ